MCSIESSRGSFHHPVQKLLTACSIFSPDRHQQQQQQVARFLRGAQLDTLREGPHVWPRKVIGLSAPSTIAPHSVQFKDRWRVPPPANQRPHITSHAPTVPVQSVSRTGQHTSSQNARLGRSPPQRNATLSNAPASQWTRKNAGLQHDREGKRKRRHNSSSWLTGSGPNAWGRGRNEAADEL